MPETESATVGSSPGEMRTQRDGRRSPPDWLLALYAAFHSDPSGSFRFKTEPRPGNTPRNEKIKTAFREEQLSFFHRLMARAHAIARGQPDSPLPPAVGQFSCRKCGESYEFDRRGMLRAALDARGEPYGTEPPVPP